MTAVSLSQGLAVVAVGATAYLAMIHLWLGRSNDEASRWTGIWAAWATALAITRIVQLDTSSPEVAIGAARLTCAFAPPLIWSLTRLVRSVTARPAGRFLTTWCPALCAALAALVFGTPWFVRPEIVPWTDLSGDPYLGAPGGPAMPLIAALVAVGWAWSLAQVLRARDLHPVERYGFAATLTIYAAMGASTVASSLGWVERAGFAEYGPLIVALGASRLLAIRSRRLELDLERTIAARTAELRESEARYRGVIEHAPLGLLVMDRSGQLEESNAAMLEMLGSTQARFESSFNVASDTSARRAGFNLMLEHTLTSGEVQRGEFEFDSWWGRRLVTRTTVAPRCDASGQVIGALAIVDDITEERALDRQLQQAQKMEAVGQLAAGIAHEINNPMAYVRSNLGTLAEDLAALRKQLAAEAAQSGALERLGEMEALAAGCIDGVQRTVAIVRELREFSRVGQEDREPTDVNELIANAIRLAATHRAAGDQIALRAGKIPAVLGARGQLRQLFLNVLLNALRVAGGGVTVSTALEGGEVCVRVHAAAGAAPRELREHLYAGAEPSTAQSAEPSLGLHVSEQIARSHGGCIRVVSDAERGTTFEVRLPPAPATP